MKKKTVLGITIALAVIIIAAAALFAKQSFENRYAEDDHFYL